MIVHYDISATEDTRIMHYFITLLALNPPSQAYPCRLSGNVRLSLERSTIYMRI